MVIKLSLFQGLPRRQIVPSKYPVSRGMVALSTQWRQCSDAWIFNYLRGQPYLNLSHHTINDASLGYLSYQLLQLIK